jgi:GNAT superfamily N-acetyltransferase
MLRLFRKKSPAPPVRNVHDFLIGLMAIAPDVGRGHYAFVADDGSARGFVQFCNVSDRDLTIHRLWTRKAGSKNGSYMLSALCDLADRHGVELKLKALPFGRKPYPLSREQLVAWYQRHGFEGTHRKLSRKPRGHHESARIDTNPHE